MATHTIYQIEAKLDDFQPVIGRTILINAERSLAYLGYTLISAFGLEGSHLFGFQKSFELLIISNLTIIYYQQWIYQNS